MTKVSIITPVYMSSKEWDDETYKAYNKTYDSIKNQTSDEFEWIIINDGSYWTPVKHKTINIKLAHLFDNYGPSVARNVGFQLSIGDIITYVDIGDELAEDRVEFLVNFWESYPNTEVLFSGYLINNDLKLPDATRFSPFGLQRYFGDYRKALEVTNTSTPLGVAHTRKPFIEAGGFQPGIVCGEDGILWRRMAEKLNSDEILLADHVAGTYYVSQTGQSRTQRRFDMGGFAFDAGNGFGSHGQYLDESWFESYNSKEWYE